MSRRMEIAKMYEKALFAGDRDAVGKLFHDDIGYWVAGAPRIGGEWRGREAVLDALSNREPGLGPADWGYEDVWREWYDAEDRVIVEIRERSWLTSDPNDLMDALVRKHHRHLTEAKIALLWRTGWKADKDGRLTLGQAKKASDLSRELVDYDFAILLNYEVWVEREFDEDARKAVLDHELCHCAVDLDDHGNPREDDRGRKVWRVRKHSVEEFTEIVRRYGTYKADLEEFAAALMQRKQMPLLEGTL